LYSARTNVQEDEDMSNTSSPTKSLYTKLAEVAAAVGHIGKDGSNDFHRYKFTSAAAVMARVNPELAARNIATVAIPTIVESREVPTKSGSQTLYVVSVAITFKDGDSGEWVTTIGLGSGMDSGDKAIMKAQTAAHKYAFKLAFSIDFGDADPEADTKTDREVAGRPGSSPTPKATPAKAPPDAESYTFRNGDYAGRPIGTLTSDVIRSLMNQTSALLADPKFPAKHTRAAKEAIAACQAVLAVREANDAPAVATPSEGGFFE